MKAVITQARLGSTRLPGKILLDLAGRTVLWHHLKRCKAINADVVVCAIPEGPENHKLIKEIKSYRLGVKIVTGPEDDVLLRYWLAAKAVDADIIIRVTSDCPLIDPAVCNQVTECLESDSNIKYVCNNEIRTWPLGLDCEAFTKHALDMSITLAVEKDHREHVCPWMKIHLLCGSIFKSGPASEGRWVLDYPEDYHFLKALFEHLPSGLPSYEEVQEVLDANPVISSLNALRRRHEQGTGTKVLDG